MVHKSTVLLFIGRAHVFGENVVSTVETRIDLQSRPVWKHERHCRSIQRRGCSYSWHCPRYLDELFTCLPRN